MVWDGESRGWAELWVVRVALSQKAWKETAQWPRVQSGVSVHLAKDWSGLRDFTHGLESPVRSRVRLKGRACFLR